MPLKESHATRRLAELRAADLSPNASGHISTEQDHDQAHRNAIWNEAMGTPLSAEERDFALRRMPIGEGSK